LNFVAGIVDFFGNFSFQLQSLVAHLIELSDVADKQDKYKHKEQRKKNNAQYDGIEIRCHCVKYYFLEAVLKIAVENTKL
jgi:hypothetical protein